MPARRETISIELPLEKPAAHFAPPKNQSAPVYLRVVARLQSNSQNLWRICPVKTGILHSAYWDGSNRHPPAGNEDFECSRKVSAIGFAASGGLHDHDST